MGYPSREAFAGGVLLTVGITYSIGFVIGTGIILEWKDGDVFIIIRGMVFHYFSKRLHVEKVLAMILALMFLLSALAEKMVRRCD